jgi:hypothetical protein
MMKLSPFAVVNISLADEVNILRFVHVRDRNIPTPSRLVSWAPSFELPDCVLHPQQTAISFADSHPEIWH